MLRYSRHFGYAKIDVSAKMITYLVNVLYVLGLISILYTVFSRRIEVLT